MFFLKIQKNKNLYASLLVASSLFLTGGFAFPSNTDAAVSIGTPFGGRSQSATYCSCTAGCWKIEVGQPRSGTFMWCPWTTTYEYYNIFPPAWQLGMATTYMSCMQISYPKCRTDGGGRVMKIVGTSMY